MWFDILKMPKPTRRETLENLYVDTYMPKFAQQKINPEYSAKVEQLGKKIADIYDELADLHLWDRKPPSRKYYDKSKNVANKLRTKKFSGIILLLRGQSNKRPIWKVDLDNALKWKDSEYKNKRVTLLRQIESELKKWGWDWD